MWYFAFEIWHLKMIFCFCNLIFKCDVLLLKSDIQMWYLWKDDFHPGRLLRTTQWTFTGKREALVSCQCQRLGPLLCQKLWIARLRFFLNWKQNMIILSPVFGEDHQSWDREMFNLSPKVPQVSKAFPPIQESLIFQ